MNTPIALSNEHQVDEFDCQTPSLNDWLRHKVFKNERRSASRTFVVCQNKTVIGYYALATSNIAHNKTPSSIRRNMPDPIPAMMLARLAVDKNWQNLGIGSGLLKDAILRTLAVSKQAGIAALLVQALTPDAARFYKYHGFLPSTLDPMTLILPTRTMQHFATEHQPKPTTATT